MDLAEAGDVSECVGITERHVDDAVVGEGGKDTQDSDLLASTGGASRDENTSVLAGEFSTCPKATGGVPEGLKGCISDNDQSLKVRNADIPSIDRACYQNGWEYRRGRHRSWGDYRA